MQIIVNAEIFHRFAALAATTENDDKRGYLRSVYVENCSAGTFIIATNSRFAAIQRIGNGGEEFKACITIDEYFLQQLETEMQFGGAIIVQRDQVSTTFGFVYPGNPFIEPEQYQRNEIKNWRSWFAGGIPQKSSGAMFMDVEKFAALVAASPSGSVVFPDHIDAGKPVIVCDAIEPDWLGVFIPQSKDGATREFSKLPDWVQP